MKCGRREADGSFGIRSNSRLFDCHSIGLLLRYAERTGVPVKMDGRGASLRSVKVVVAPAVVILYA